MMNIQTQLDNEASEPALNFPGQGQTAGDLIDGPQAFEDSSFLARNLPAPNTSNENSIFPKVPNKKSKILAKINEIYDTDMKNDSSSDHNPLSYALKTKTRLWYEEKFRKWSR